MPPSATAEQHRLRILFLSAHPTSAGEQRRIGEELRAVEEKIQRAPHRDALARLETRWAVRPADLQQALLEVKPHIVHFSGQGTEAEAILLENDQGGPQPVSKEALGQLFRILKDSVRIVVLNACHSRAQAEAITEHIDCAIGMQRAVRHDAAVAFAAAFYGAIAFGRSVQEAFELGQNALELEGIDGGELPELSLRRGVDAAKVILLEEGRSSEKRVPLPPNNLPPRRLFVGREEELKTLTDALAREGRASVTQSGRASIHGLGGVGKTALALELAHLRAGDYPGGVWWLAAEGKPLDGLVRLSAILKAGAPTAMKERVDLDAREAEALAEAARMALQNHPEPSLLVLDNVDDRGWVDRVPGGFVNVLVTTRDARLALGATAALGRLSREEATALAEALAGVPGSAEELEARERVIVRELDGLAVAVEMAARAVHEWALGWRAYEQHLKREMETLLEEESLHGQYPRGVFAALDLSIGQCRPGTAERRLLEGAAVFAPKEVPFGWAFEAAGLDPAALDAARARAWLAALGLVEGVKGEATVSMHRLVHRRVRELAPRASEKTWAQSCDRGAECVASWLKKTVDPTRMADVDARRAHIDAALDAAERAGSETRWIRIADRLARHLRHRAIYGEACVWFEQALKRAERLEPPDPARVAASLSNLAGVLRELGQAAEARSLRERALSITEMTYGPDHANVATCLSNLAMVLKDLGQVAEARPLLERALAIHEKSYGADHPSVATTLAHLAATLKTLGQATEAHPLLARALAIDEKTYDADHPTVASDLSSLAMVLRDLGQATEARPLLVRALAIQEQIYGPEHPKIARSLSNLAAVLRDLGQATEARCLLERALAIAESTLPPHHPSRTGIARNLEKVLTEL